MNVYEFIESHYTPYDGDDRFLAPITDKTRRVWNACLELLKEETIEGAYRIDARTPSDITSHGPGYINEDDDVIVGLQGCRPLERTMKPLGGHKLVQTALKERNEVFSVYTAEQRARRESSQVCQTTMVVGGKTQ